MSILSFKIQKFNSVELLFRDVSIYRFLRNLQKTQKNSKYFFFDIDPLFQNPKIQFGRTILRDRRYIEKKFAEDSKKFQTFFFFSFDLFLGILHRSLFQNPKKEKKFNPNEPRDTPILRWRNLQRTRKERDRDGWKYFFARLIGEFDKRGIRSMNLCSVTLPRDEIGHVSPLTRRFSVATSLEKLVIEGWRSLPGNHESERWVATSFIQLLRNAFFIAFDWSRKPYNAT